jgi:excisionase family DNA binding protein
MNFIVLEEEKLNAIIDKIEAVQKTLLQQESMGSSQKQWLTVKQAADYLNVTTRSLYNYKDRGLIAFSVSGGKLLFRKVDLERYLVEHRVEALTHRNGRM